MSWSFQKAEIFCDGEDLVIVEKVKDEEKSYNLSEVLKSLEGVEGLSIKINYDNEIPTE